MAPFDGSSGSSRRRGRHIRRTGSDRQLRALLAQAARAAVVYDNELRHYYRRKMEEGKPPKAVINNVRNKLLHRIFAVVRKKQAFQSDYRDPLNILRES
jgi:hypothetical protein